MKTLQNILKSHKFMKYFQNFKKLRYSSILKQTLQNKTSTKNGNISNEAFLKSFTK